MIIATATKMLNFSTAPSPVPPVLASMQAAASSQSSRMEKPPSTSSGSEPSTKVATLGLKATEGRHSAFTERPKHLDPVQSYSEDEITFTAQIYEPPLQYHYLKRPYALAAATVEAVPQPRYSDAQGQPLADDLRS